MTPRFRRAFAAATATAALLVTAGCGSDSSTTDPSTTAEASSFPVAITSSLGTAEIKTEPKRVITLGWGSTEAALALGVTPVGMRNMKSDSGTDDGILPWVKDKLGDAQPELIEETSKAIPFEQIAALDPDVILAVQSGLTAEQYAQLEKIAPTVASPGKPWQTSWQDQTTIVGQALGKESEAKALIADTDKKIAEAKAANPTFAGRTAVAASATTADGLNYYFDTDPRNKLLAGLGFTSLPAITQLREAAPAGKFAAPVSWENVSLYNADVMTSWFLDEGLQKATEANPLFSSLPVVQKNAYVPLTDPPLVFAVSSPNVLNMDWLLERYVPLLQTAVKNAG